MSATEPLLIGLLGVLVVVSILVDGGLRRVGVPGLVGFLAMGVLLNLGDATWGLIPRGGSALLEVLARLGIVALLFRVGLESDVSKLRAQLGRAGPIWLSSVLVSGALGYATARWILEFGTVPSLFAGIALTATSVGVSLGTWREEDALSGKTGALLVDTVELDDFSGVLLMAVLFGVAPLLREGDGQPVLGSLIATLGLVALKAGLFLAACALFARYVEERLTRMLERHFGDARRIVVVAGVGLLIATAAELLGLSFAIGAFFAGLVFSRDPDSVKLDASFEDLYALLVPFFFIWLGFGFDPVALGAAALPALWLVPAAIVGKVAGTGLAAVPSVGWIGGLALGVSVVPRAEIMMVVMARGLQLGDWAVPSELFATSVLVVLATSVTAPLVVRRLLDARPDLKR